MAKFYTIIAILAITLALVAAEPARFRQAQRFAALRVPNNRKFARQEAAPSPAPYPAAGVTPEIPFDLPTETEKPFAEPDQTYGPPDQTYGPPEATPDQTYGPPETTPDQTYGPPDAAPAVTEPDSTYGPPENSDDQLPAIEEPAAEEIQPADTDLISQNLIQPRNKWVRSRSRSAPLRVRSVPVQPRGSFVEIIRSEPVLVYTLH